MRLTIITCTIIVCDKFASAAQPYGQSAAGLIAGIMFIGAILDVRDAFRSSK